MSGGKNIAQFHSRNRRVLRASVGILKREVLGYQHRLKLSRQALKLTQVIRVERIG
jgi:hypothetical protein